MVSVTTAVGGAFKRHAFYHGAGTIQRVGKTLVTGAAGFIGSHLARALAQRGDDLRLLVRRSARLGHLEGFEFEPVRGEITDRRAVRRAMNGVERVFHVAGRTSLHARDREAVWNANVRGAHIVFEEALAAGVERLVHTSTAGAIGVARPRGTVDETATFTIGHLGISYVNSKHEAELEALRLGLQGLPVVIVNPAFVLGPDDPTGTSMSLVRRFLLRRIPVYVDGGLNVVDVRDVAQGHLLADAKGQVGERYILSARNFTLDRLFADLSRVSGVEAPQVKVPASVLSSLVDAGSRARMPVPASPDEVRSAGQWWTYRNTKAKRELGFEPRSHEATLEDAVHWQMDVLGDRVGRGRGGAEQLAMAALGRALRLGERIRR